MVEITTHHLPITTPRIDVCQATYADSSPYGGRSAKMVSAFRERVFLFCFVLVSSSMLLPLLAQAEPIEPSGFFELEIRTIEATDPLQGDLARTERYIDTRIDDLRSQLQRLHYRNFKLLAAQRERVLPRRKTMFPLSHGHQLAVKPLYIDGNRVGVWLRWVDGSGSQVLDTRMHLTCGESIITGTDRNNEEGVIVAIRPSNVQRAGRGKSK